MRLVSWARTCARIVLLVLTAMAIVLPAHAHLMSAGQGTVRLVDDSAYAVISVPVAVLTGFDDNRDGLVNVDEINAHRDDLSRQLSRILTFQNAGQPGKLIFEDMLLSHLDEPNFKGGSYIVVVRRYQWSEAVQSFSLRADMFGTPATADTQLVVRGIRGEENEAAILSKHRNEYAFFTAPWVTFGSFVMSGMQHILLGADHLMFLLTVLVVGVGWRYWLGVVTSFTIAHSITLTLAALDVVKVPSAVVEPLIAASIVLLAIDNLRRGQAATRHKIPLVFGCGLLHGLGIASALTDAGLSEGNRTLGLLGFNFGVEFGQMLFVGSMLALMWLVRRTIRTDLQEKMVLACSLVAAFAGAGWMVQRLV